MGKWFRAKPGKAAVYSHPADSWDPLDNPLNYLSDVYWHSDLDYLEVAFRGQPTINHPAVADSNYGTTNGTGSTGMTVQPSAWRSAPATATYTLYTHNLGYRPQVLVQVGNEIITPGYAIQSHGNGVRLLSVIVTTTAVQLRETVWTWGGTLPALSRTYDVIGLVKATPFAPAADLLIEPGAMVVGRGKIDTTRRYLRASMPGEDRFWVTDGKTGDARNGVVRTVSPLGTVRDDAVFGSSAYNYNGSFGAGSVSAHAISIADSAEETGTFTHIGVDEEMLVVDDGHIVVDSSRPMAKFIGSVSASNVVCSFPEPTQDVNVWSNARFLGGVVWGMGFNIQATWAPQEWSHTINLGAVNPDTNFVIGQVRGAQTHAPQQIGGNGGASASGSGSTPWEINPPSGGYRNLPVMIPQNTWLQANGTLILEASYMFRRTITFRKSGSQLQAVLQQSVGGYNTNNATYRSNHPEDDFGNYDREVIARAHRYGAKLNEGGSVAPPGGSGSDLDPRGKYSWNSVWQFDLEFLTGHI